MTNREKYKFDDFTLTNYKRLINIAKEQGYSFILHKDEYVESRKDVIWRHDVEFSPTIALQMAEIEHDEGVRATYFWQLHSDYYNTSSMYFTGILSRIHDLGHHIGLHFDSHYWKIENSDRLDYYLEKDAKYLEDIMKSAGIEDEVDTFSFHNTNSFILGCEEYTYGNLINVYSAYFKKMYAYCGDSTGIWRFDRLEDRLLDSSINHLQVLTHDAMWSEKVLSPHARIMDSIQFEADRKKNDYISELPKTGNIDVGENSINPNIDER